MIAEVELNGPLVEIWDVFNSVLGQEEPVLRVTAFLGVILENDKGVAIESLTLAGCFVGCNIQYPASSKLLRITSLGASISIANNGEAALLDAAKAAVLPNAIEEKTNGQLTAQEQLAVETEKVLPTSSEDAKPIAPYDTTNSEILGDAMIEAVEETEDEEKEEEQDGADEEIEASADTEGGENGDENEDEDEEKLSHYINYSIFGTVELPVPGQPLALALDLDLSVVKNMMIFTMSPKGEKKAWDNVFGFDNFDVGYSMATRWKVGLKELT